DATPWALARKEAACECWKMREARAPRRRWQASGRSSSWRAGRLPAYPRRNRVAAHRTSLSPHGFLPASVSAAHSPHKPSGQPDLAQARVLGARAMTDFQKSDAGLACQDAPKFEREDWALFRTVEGLQQRAGVSKSLLSRLILKELADNGLDNGAEVTVQALPHRGSYLIEDDGTGIDGTPE